MKSFIFLFFLFITNILFAQVPNFPYVDSSKKFEKTNYDADLLLTVNTNYVTGWNTAEKIWTMESTGYDPQYKFSVTIENANNITVTYNDVTKIIVGYDNSDYLSIKKVQVLYINGYERIGVFEHLDPLRISVQGLKN